MRENQTEQPKTISESDEPKRAENKRKTSAFDSCDRTDLMSVSPNAGKAECLDILFDAYKDPSDQIADILLHSLLAGEDVIAWKLVAAPNPLAGRSTILQPEEAQAKGQLKSHMGWLKKNFGKSISKLVRRLKFKVQKQGLAGEQLLQALIRIEAFAHELRAVNAR